MRNRVTGGYQYETRHSAPWERPTREIGPIRFLLLTIVPLVAFVLLVAAFR